MQKIKLMRKVLAKNREDLQEVVNTDQALKKLIAKKKSHKIVIIESEDEEKAQP